MTLINKVQRAAVPALRPFLPKMPVQFFHKLNSRVSPLRNMPASVIPFQQITSYIARPYSDESQKTSSISKLLLSMSIGSLSADQFNSSSNAQDIKKPKTLISDHLTALSIFNQLEAELPGLNSDEIAIGMSFSYFLEFSDEDAFDRHLIIFAQSVERYNQTSSEHLTLGEAFKAYKACREAILRRPDEKNDRFGYNWFSCYDKNLTYVPPEIAFLKGIDKLFINFHGCHIAALPDQFKELAANLKGLQFLEATFETIPSIIFQLSNLVELKSISGHLQEISPEIIKLKNLESLDLSYNQIEKIPNKLRDLKHLKIDIKPIPPFFLNAKL